jgi:hypothetical protein
VLSVLCLKIVGKNMSLSLREKLVRMIIFCDSKIIYLNKVLQNMFLLVGVSLLLLGLALFACASCSAPSSLKQSFSRLPMPAVKEERNGSSECCHILQPKSRSFSLVDTSPIWGKQHSVEFWVFTSDQVLEDD